MFVPNEQQLAVGDFISHEKGSLNVIARAGTGKTATLVQEVVRRIVEEKLGELAIMAFNKAASEEFKSRIAELAKETDNADFSNFKICSAGTVHSFGLNAWKYVAKYVKVDGNKVRTIINGKQDQARLNIYAKGFAPIVQLVSLAKQAAFGVVSPVDDKSKWFDLADHFDVDFGELSADAVVTAAIDIFNESVSLDREVIDFDDMILAPLIHNVRMFQKDFVLIDEAQDTNASRRALALKMLKPTGRLISVGDDKQSIYGFTGADSNALSLIKAAVNATELPLSITYRCPKAVVAEANVLVPDLVAHPSAPEGLVRSLTTINPKGEHWFITDAPRATDVVLCRLTAPLIEQAYACIVAGVGCRVEGRDIGEGLIQLANRWKSVHTLSQLVTKLDDFQHTETQKWASRDKAMRAQQIEDRCETLRLICNQLIVTNKTSIADLTTFIRGLFGDTPEGEAPKVLTFSTIHKSKGREWNRVYILNRKTTIPTKWARQKWQLNQEYNLEYVALTRAKEELVYLNEVK